MSLAIQTQFGTSVFGSDWYAYILALVWGFTIGSGVCCHMMLIVDMEETDKALASKIAIVCLQFGLVVAAFLGIILQYAVIPYL